MKFRRAAAACVAIALMLPLAVIGSSPSASATAYKCTTNVSGSWAAYQCTGVVGSKKDVSKLEVSKSDAGNNVCDIRGKWTYKREGRSYWNYTTTGTAWGCLAAANAVGKNVSLTLTPQTNVYGYVRVRSNSNWDGGAAVTICGGWGPFGELC